MQLSCICVLVVYVRSQCTVAQCTSVQCTKVQVYRITGVQAYSVQTFRCTGVQCTNVQVYKSTGVQTCSVQAYRCTFVQVYACSPTRVGGCGTPRQSGDRAAPYTFFPNFKTSDVRSPAKHAREALWEAVQEPSSGRPGVVLKREADDLYAGSCAV